mgnify:FL=1|jgi:hypothetical protein
MRDFVLGLNPFQGHFFSFETPPLNLTSLNTCRGLCESTYMKFWYGIVIKKNLP